MRIQLVTLFPEIVTPWIQSGILGRAVSKGLVSVSAVNPRDWARDIHHRVDDYVYGGGPGMLLKPDVMQECITALRKKGDRVIAMVPGGRTLDRKTLVRLATLPGLILVSGRYEGFDSRFLETAVDERISVGDYVVMGGEAPALILLEGVVRRLDHVLHDADSVARDSFENGLLEEDAYTRPRIHCGMEVPEVLIGGNHARIEAWRRASSIQNTYKYRPELLLSSILDDSDRIVLKNSYKELYCGEHHTGHRRKTDEGRARLQHR
ncbi:MAG TPA: tRNA (guanosine(37)-N1)-methyltransferase TrmD [Spirochaetota bacterium]|nr:tRNA (guanosine(37)-N1)-methyltransferase TrmD [Spirochaetota bacterium]HPN82477.1 tRNA (guanosine(37)-N1)-methyltransferase TrmD [Spirochaetota bacterium]